MKHIKTYRIFESKESVLDLCWYNAEIGQILPESDIYEYIKKLHRNEDDFYDGDLGDRIGEFSKYKLMEIDIDKINIDEWDLDVDYLKDYKNNLKKIVIIRLSY